MTDHLDVAREIVRNLYDALKEAANEVNDLKQENTALRQESASLRRLLGRYQVFQPIKDNGYRRCRLCMNLRARIYYRRLHGLSGDGQPRPLGEVSEGARST